MARLLELKSDRRARCERAGRNIRVYQERQSSLRTQVSEFRNLVHDTESEIGDLGQRIEQIAANQDALRAVGGRFGPGGTIATEVGAQLIGLARQKDALERRLEQLQSNLSRIIGPLRDAETQLAETNRLLSQSHDAFDRLGCTISDLPF